DPAALVHAIAGAACAQRALRRRVIAIVAARPAPKSRAPVGSGTDGPGRSPLRPAFPEPAHGGGPGAQSGRPACAASVTASASIRPSDPRAIERSNFIGG